MADQTITFTRRTGITVGPENFTVTIQDGETPNNLENITDDEARAAITQARTAQAGVDLTNYDISTPDDPATTTVTPTAFAHDRYEGLVNESATPPPADSDPLARQRPYRLTLDILGSDVPSGGVGGNLVFTWRHPFSQNHSLDYGPGLGVRGLSLWGDPRSLSLSQSDVDTGVTSLTDADSLRIDAFFRARYQGYIGDRFFLGALVDAGLGIIPGTTTGHKPSGNDYQTSYCGDSSGGGIFGNDQGTGGCTNRPLGPHAQPGADNNTSSSTTGVGLLARVGPVVGVDIASWLTVAATGGVEAYVPFTGPVPTSGGWFGGLTLTGSFGAPEPTMSRESTPPPTAPATTELTATTATRGEAVNFPAPTGGWLAGDRIFVNGTDIGATLTAGGTDPVAIPASALTDGANTIELRRADGSIIRWAVTINAPAEATTRVEVSGVILEPVASATGSTGSDLTVGSILTDRDTINVRLTYADGSQEVRTLTRTAGSTGQVTHPIVVSAAKLGAEGSRSVIVQVVEVPTLIRQISYTVRPPTNFAAAPTLDRVSYSNRERLVPVLTVNAVAAVDGATITVNGAPLHGFSGHLNAGSQTFNITNTNIGTGANRFNNNVKDAPVGTYAVVITMPGGESRTIQLVIERPAGSGTGTRRHSGAPGGGSGH